MNKDQMKEYFRGNEIKNEWLEKLNFRERYIIEHWPEMTLKQIGEQFGVSRSRIGQVRNNAVRKIWKMIEMSR